MKSDTITLVISALLLAVALFVLFAGHRRRRRHRERLRVTDLLKNYFKGDVPANQIHQRIRDIVSRNFMGTDEFYALVVSAFQGAVDESPTQPTPAKQAERKLLSAMAVLKNECGLTDRYQIDPWRPWRE
jgi:hypothetical protein